MSRTPEAAYADVGYRKSAYGESAYGGEEFEEPYEDADGQMSTRRHGSDPVRHAYYPGRRMNLGVVLLPLRVFLGFISLYAGMGKLCDPVYFDGGERGSMVKWLSALHPWEIAEPLRQFALEHPVGAGLVIAFSQVIVGVLTVLGLWQRVAAVFGALLSAALLVTVSWKTVPAYDAPDIIYLAAWSPLIIAGAPVYSVDGRLAGSAWRRLGPRADLWELRRYVLRRGALVTTLAVGAHPARRLGARWGRPGHRPRRRTRPRRGPAQRTARLTAPREARRAREAAPRRRQLAPPGRHFLRPLPGRDHPRRDPRHGRRQRRPTQPDPEPSRPGPAPADIPRPAGPGHQHGPDLQRRRVGRRLHGQPGRLGSARVSRMSPAEAAPPAVASPAS